MIAPYVTSDANATVEAAEAQLPGLTVRVRSTTRTLAAIRQLKAEIEADRDELSAQGVALDGVGIRTEGDGPRALIVAEPDDQMTREWLADTYGANRIVVVGGEVIPQ